MFFTVFFYVFSRKKNCAMTAGMLFMNDTLDEEDVLMTFDELEVQTDLCRSHFREDDFKVSHLRYMLPTTMHAD